MYVPLKPPYLFNKGAITAFLTLWISLLSLLHWFKSCLPLLMMCCKLRFLSRFICGYTENQSSLHYSKQFSVLTGNKPSPFSKTSLLLRTSLSCRLLPSVGLLLSRNSSTNQLSSLHGRYTSSFLWYLAPSKNRKVIFHLNPFLWSIRTKHSGYEYVFVFILKQLYCFHQLI